MKLKSRFYRFIDTYKKTYYNCMRLYIMDYLCIIIYA